VKNEIKAAIKKIPVPTPTPKASATPSAKPTPLLTPEPTPTPTLIPGPTTIVPTPQAYTDLMVNGEFESVTTTKVSGTDLTYPQNFTITASATTCPKSDVGTTARGYYFKGGFYSSSNVKIPITYAGKEVLISCDAKMVTVPKISGKGFKAQIDVKGTTGSVKAVDPNILSISDIDFAFVQQSWKHFNYRVKLSSLAEMTTVTQPYFSVYLSAVDGAFVIDNLQVVPMYGKDNIIEKFSFLKANNPALLSDIPCTINHGTGEIFARLPEGVLINSLKPSFSVSAGKVFVAGYEQTSGVTSQNFLNDVDYYVVENGISKKYQVHIHALNTTLPSLVVNTQGSIVISTQDTYLQGTAGIQGGTVGYSVVLPSAPMQIKGRGMSSWGMDKKGYKIRFNTSTSVLGMPANKDWLLIANYSDKSLMRNYLAYTVAASLDGMAFTPRMKFVNLFLNGRYNGLYLIGDQIESGKSRIDITKTTGVDTGFILEVNERMNSNWNNPGWNNPAPVIPYIYTQSSVVRTITTGSYDNYFMEFTDPKASEMTTIQMNSIAAQINTIDKAVNTRNPTTYDPLIDYSSFNDWFIAEELFKNLDSGFFASCYMYKDVGGKLKMGPVWDFDSSVGNHTDSYFNNPNGWVYSGGSWLSSVSLSGEGLTRLKARWKAIKAQKVDIINNLINQTAEMIRPSYVENFDLWKIQGLYVWPNSPEIVAALTLDQHTTLMKDWFTKRITWMDTQLGT